MNNYMDRASACIDSIITQLNQIRSTEEAGKYIENCDGIYVAEEPLSPGTDVHISDGDPAIVLDIGTGKLRYRERGGKTVSAYIPERVRKLLFESQYPY